eukprot:9605550-Karenia_brevis.AAC.1
MHGCFARPYVISFNAAILTGKKHGQWQHAALLIDEMCGGCLMPDVMEFNAAIPGKGKHQP